MSIAFILNLREKKRWKTEENGRERARQFQSPLHLDRDCSYMLQCPMMFPSISFRSDFVLDMSDLESLPREWRPNFRRYISPLSFSQFCCRHLTYFSLIKDVLNFICLKNIYSGYSAMENRLRVSYLLYSIWRSVQCLLAIVDFLEGFSLQGRRLKTIIF